MLPFFHVLRSTVVDQICMRLLKPKTVQSTEYSFVLHKAHLWGQSEISSYTGHAACGTGYHECENALATAKLKSGK